MAAKKQLIMLQGLSPQLRKISLKLNKYLFGRKCILQRDHKPLLAIFLNKNGIPAHYTNRLQRWALTLMSYDFKLQYVSTHEFGVADILSRLISNALKANEDTIIACIQLENDIKIVISDITNALPITFNVICAVLKMIHISKIL